MLRFHQTYFVDSSEWIFCRKKLAGLLETLSRSNFAYTSKLQAGSPQKIPLLPEYIPENIPKLFKMTISQNNWEFRIWVRYKNNNFLRQIQFPFFAKIFGGLFWIDYACSLPSCFTYWKPRFTVSCFILKKLCKVNKKTDGRTS